MSTRKMQKKKKGEIQHVHRHSVHIKEFLECNQILKHTAMKAVGKRC